MKYWLYSVVMKLMGVLPDKGKAIRWRGDWARFFLQRAGRNLKLASGVGIYFPENLSCGDSVYIGYGTYIGGGAVHLDDEVVIGPHCAIVAGNHTMEHDSYRFGEYDFGEIYIGRGTWIAAHVTVTSGVTIGKGCLIAANSVVTRDVADFTTVGGVPGKVLARRVSPHDVVSREV